MGCHTICINQTMNIMGRITTAMSVFTGIRPNFKNNFRTGILNHRKGFLAVSGQKSASIWVMTMVMFLISAMGMAQTQETTLNPADDAYLQRFSSNPTNELLYNDETIRLENSNSRLRDGYLKFDLSPYIGQIVSLELTLTVYSDAGVNGNINVYKGIGDAWTEDDLSNATKPAQGTLIGFFAAPYPKTGSGITKVITIDPNFVSSSGLLSLKLVHTGPNNDDMAFASNGPEGPDPDVTIAPQSKRPKLKVTYSTTTDTPPVINSFTGTAISDTQIDLSWSATDDNGVTGYTLTMNGATQSLSSSTATSFSATGLTADTSYDFQLTASDGGSNATVSGVETVTTLSEGGGPTGGFWTQTGSDISYTAGHVGIGTAPRSLQMLAVAGEIIATRVRVEEQPNWPDYVFNEDYRLPSLEEVQEHIEAHGHLINIPSAADVAANGMDLGEMNRLLLEKVEELTLYLLQQDQELKALQTQISTLEKE